MPSAIFVGPASPAMNASPAATTRVHGTSFAPHAPLTASVELSSSTFPDPSDELTMILPPASTTSLAPAKSIEAVTLSVAGSMTSTSFVIGSMRPFEVSVGLVHLNSDVEAPDTYVSSPVARLMRAAGGVSMPCCGTTRTYSIPSATVASPGNIFSPSTTRSTLFVSAPSRAERRLTVDGWVPSALFSLRMNATWSSLP